MAKPIQLGEGEILQDIHFPLAGLDVSRAFSRQPNRPVGATGRSTPTNDSVMVGGQSYDIRSTPSLYARSTAYTVNCRGFEPQSQRARGGSRAGLKRYVLAPAIAGWLIQGLDVVVLTDPSAVG